MKSIIAKSTIALIFLLWLNTGGSAQELKIIDIELDDIGKIRTTIIPFDVPFILRIKSTKKLTRVELELEETKYPLISNCQQQTTGSQQQPAVNQQQSTEKTTSSEPTALRRESTTNSGEPTTISEEPAGKSSKIAKKIANYCWSASDEGGTGSVVLQIAPLKHNRYCKSTFRLAYKPDENQLQKFRKMLVADIIKTTEEAFIKYPECVDNIAKYINEKIPEILKSEKYKAYILNIPEDTIFYEKNIDTIYKSENFKERVKQILHLVRIDTVITTLKNIDKPPYHVIKDRFMELGKCEIPQNEISKNKEDIIKGKEIFKKLIEIIKKAEDQIDYFVSGTCHIENASKCSELHDQQNDIYKFTIEKLEKTIETKKDNFCTLLSQIELIEKFIKYTKQNCGIIGAIKEDIKGQIALVNDAKDNLLDCKKHIEKLAGDIGLEILDDMEFVFSTRSDFKTRAKWSIIPDIGLAYSFGLHEVIPYLGLNFYFRPINRDVPIWTLEKLTDSNNEELYKPGCLWSRLSLMIGISIKSIASTGIRENLFANSALMVGPAIRLNDSVMIAGGVVLFKELSPNPLLINKKVIHCDSFASLSIDLDLKEIFSDLFGLVTGKESKK